MSDEVVVKKSNSIKRDIKHIESVIEIKSKKNNHNEIDSFWEDIYFLIKTGDIKPSAYVIEEEFNLIYINFASIFKAYRKYKYNANELPVKKMKLLNELYKQSYFFRKDQSKRYPNHKVCKFMLLSFKELSSIFDIQK